MLHEREKAILETLDKLPKQHVVLIGGYAVNVYVPPRFSIDCDLVVLDGLANLEVALKKEGFVRTEKGDVPNGSYVRYEKKEQGVSFDLLVNTVLDRSSGVAFEAKLFEGHAKKRIAVGRVNPIRIELRVADPELLFAMKFAAGRRSDVRDLFMLAGEDLDWKVVEEILRGRCAPALLKERATAIRLTVEAVQYRPNLQGAFGKIPDERYKRCETRLLGFLSGIAKTQAQ